MFNGRRQPSCGGTSRMTRECQVRICERLGVKFPGPTRQVRTHAPQQKRHCHPAEVEEHIRRNWIALKSRISHIWPSVKRWHQWL